MAAKVSTVLVTGADGALGSVVARRFSSAGCKVTGTCFRSGSHPDLPGVNWVETNLADADSIRSKLGSLEPDALVHCAGGFRFAGMDEFSDKDLDFLIDANLRSSFFLCRHFLPGMKKRGFGRIVFVSSKTTLNPPAGMGPYAASKGGINELTLAVSEEVKRFDITVNAVLPTVIDTPANRKDMPQADFSSWVPREELAEIIFSLTQPWAQAIRGALIPVSGRV